jgi:hypothetical protein
MTVTSCVSHAIGRGATYFIIRARFIVLWNDYSSRGKINFNSCIWFLNIQYATTTKQMRVFLLYVLEIVSLDEYGRVDCCCETNRHVVPRHCCIGALAQENNCK